tara:strand:+ start:490 stop:1536 length:1047 start_codon:yes stop_codon:yes gene_type:complete
MAYTTIDDASVYFRIKLYTGNGSTNAITFDETHANMQPDWCWIKRRSGGASNAGAFDSVRGATKVLSPSLDQAEETRTDSLTSFDSNGFTLGSDGGNYVNTNSETFVGWCWKSGSAFSNSAGANGASIASSGIASSAAGMSIFTFTSTGSQSTIAHGLGVTPDLYIIKKRGTTTGHWFVYTTVIDDSLDRYLLNLTSAKGDDSNTVPSSTIITSDNGSNGNTMVCYAFKMHQGFSRFGFYQGNGESTNGTYVHTGFTPSWVMTKRSDDTQNWEIYDRKRSPLNDGNNERLRANLGNAEDSQNGCDFYANGFKWRNNNDSKNTNGATYLYLAFAESPFVNSSGVPTNSR